MLQIKEKRVDQQRDEALAVEQELFVDVGHAEVDDGLAVSGPIGQECRVYRVPMVRHLNDLVNVSLTES